MQEKIHVDIPPFRLSDHIYFVGSRRVSVHLIDTGAGLLLLDTGYPDMEEQILQSIRALGFAPEDICAIFHSHGHYDHIGCTQRLKQLSGATTYISRIDHDIVNGTLDLSWARELGYAPLPPFTCNVLMEDGDVYDIGNVRIRCLLTPGHTDGTLSFFIETEEKGKPIVAAMHGGTGRNSMRRDFLEKHGLSLSCRERFREGLHALAREHVDLVLGNHPEQSDTEGKRARLLRGEGSVTDPCEWQRFLRLCEKKLDALLAEEAEE